MSYPAIRPTRRPASRIWDPASDLSSFRTEMLRMLGLLSGVQGDGGLTGEIEMEETDDGWMVTAQLPGFAPDQVSVEVEGRDLSIQAKTGDEEPAEGEHPGRRASLRYRLTIPGEVDPEQIEATMEHGLLTVRLPRSGKSRRRAITVGKRTVEGELSNGG